MAGGHRSSVIKPTEQKGRGCNLAEFERQVDAMHDHRQVFDRLNAKSQAIIQHFCLDELPIRKFELSQVPQWSKGAGTVRLREALDDLVEIYKQNNK